MSEHLQVLYQDVTYLMCSFGAFEDVVLRLVDKKHRKQLSNPVVMKLAEKALIALHDLERQCDPQLGIGISSLSQLDTDNETRWNLVSMLERYDLNKYSRDRHDWVTKSRLARFFIIIKSSEFTDHIPLLESQSQAQVVAFANRRHVTLLCDRVVT